MQCIIFMAFLIFLNQESHHGELVHKSDCLLCVLAYLCTLCVCVCMYRYGYMRYISLMHEGAHKGHRI
jgi:hypothetical protein